ncbi:MULTISPECIES: helix-turn-helix domain-containing protein [Nocardia]|uniref:helix-turn-helix domain-containing protein n=1 Tax=Nocardia TaxID=1817 RepID=UPI000AC77ACF|nr:MULTISPECIES: helix-turn-helix domain-containing protein [Nocardia]
MDSIVGSTRELMPVDTFEWQRILRRVQIAASAKHLGLTMSTYANADGSHIVAGVERLARVMCVSEPTVKRGLAELRRVGLVERVKQGNRHAKKSDEYRLTMPSDVLDLPMLDPDEQAVSGGHS